MLDTPPQQISDQDLLQLFGTYWSYLMFINQKQASVGLIGPDDHIPLIDNQNNFKNTKMSFKTANTYGP